MGDKALEEALELEEDWDREELEEGLEDLKDMNIISEDSEIR